MEFALSIPIITAIIQALKIAFLPSRFAPLVAIFLGVTFSAFTNTSFNFDVALFGVIIGLSSVGLYSGGKSQIETVKEILKK